MTGFVVVAASSQVNGDQSFVVRTYPTSAPLLKSCAAANLYRRHF